MRTYIALGEAVEPTWKVGMEVPKALADDMGAVVEGRMG
jgi:hypothetical protein